jgi:hypothetical protein
MVLPAGSTGLRRSEMFALRWRDVNFTTREVQVQRAVVRNRFGNVKTLASKKPVPLHPSVADELVQWRTQSAYRTDEDFLFPSIKLNGEVPVSPDTVLKKLTGLNTSISSSSFGLPLPRPSQQPTQPSGKPAPRFLRQSTIHQSGHPKKCRYKLHLID